MPAAHELPEGMNCTAVHRLQFDSCCEAAIHDGLPSFHAAKRQFILMKPPVCCEKSFPLKSFPTGEGFFIASPCEEAYPNGEDLEENDPDYEEYDDEEESVVQLSENVFSIDGATTLSELMELTGEEVTSEDCETVAGLILESLSGIPEEDERPTVQVGKLKLTADEIEDRRITKVLVEIECQ